MKPLALAGAIVTALGLLAFVMGGGIPYKSSKDVPAHSKTQITIHEDRVLSIPPAAAASIVILGVGLMIVGSRK